MYFLIDSGVLNVITDIVYFLNFILLFVSAFELNCQMSFLDVLLDSFVWMEFSLWNDVSVDKHEVKHFEDLILIIGVLNFQSYLNDNVSFGGVN